MDPSRDKLPGELRAGDLHIVTGTHQVFRNGVEIALPKLTFDLLVALARHAPNTVSYEQLMQEVWPGLVVGPDTVTQRVKLLRIALGDDPQTPAYIGAVRGRGYRLLVPVLNSAAAAAPGSSRRYWPRPGGWLALAAAALVLGSLFVFRSPIPASPVSGLPGRASVAVLPFSVLTPGASEQAIFAAGIHDELLTRLAQIEGLDVISRGSVLRYRDSDRPVPDIARELGVGSLLEGSVQQQGSRVRINVQLIDAASDTHLWAEVYDRELTVANLLDIQADIARTIAGELRVELQPQRIAAMSSSTTSDLDAYALYLQANEFRYRWLDSGETDLLLVAEDHYRRAIDLDPEFALAHASLGRLLAEIYWQRARPRSAALLEQSRSAAEYALQLSPGLAEAHLALAGYHYYGFRRYDEALAEVAQAEQAMPGYADIFFVKATVLRRLGRLDDCVAAAKRLYELSPGRRSETLLYGGLLVYQGRLDEAAKVYLRRLEQAPDDLPAMIGVANLAYLRTGLLDELRDVAERAVRDEPGLAWQVAWATADDALARAALSEMRSRSPLAGDMPAPELLAGLTQKALGREAEARAILLRLREDVEREIAIGNAGNLHNAWMTLAEIHAALNENRAAIDAGRRAVELLAMEKDRYQGAYLQIKLAMIYAQAGETDLALDTLEKGLREPFAPLPLYWQPDRRLASLHGLPRFESIVNRFGAGGMRWRSPG
jgi:TolB-like protein/DNA-binding winged helix-turn-helix (wHTH) protein/Tfp pilus assembly protein PilF